MTLQRLVYRSTALDVTGSEFRRIVAVSERSNRKQAITGALTLCDGHFIQVLEGPADRLDHLLERLGGDPRHSDLRVLGRWSISSRLFCGWAMAGAPAIGACTGVTDWLKHNEDGLAMVSVMFEMANAQPNLTQSKTLTEPAAHIFCTSCGEAESCSRKPVLRARVGSDLMI